MEHIYDNLNGNKCFSKRINIIPYKNCSLFTRIQWSCRTKVLSMHDLELTQEMWGSIAYHIQTLAESHVLWKGNVHSYKYLKVWGCFAKSHCTNS